MRMDVDRTLVFSVDPGLGAVVLRDGGRNVLAQKSEAGRKRNCQSIIAPYPLILKTRRSQKRYVQGILLAASAYPCLTF